MDAIDRAHLRDRAGFTPPVHRFDVSADLTDLVRRHWIPLWSLPPGQSTTQRVLRYPVCLITVAPDGARFLGPATGLSTKTLTGAGWTVGLMLQPAAGWLITGRPIAELCDREIDLASLRGFESTIAEVTEAMALTPECAESQAQARALMERAMRRYSADDEGRFVNEVVAAMESDDGVTRVSEVAERFGTSERTLQRVFARRVGLSPRWVLGRRRLWNAVQSLREQEVGQLAAIAADLGYTDQAHFTRDFRAVVGMTPGQFQRE